MNVSSADRKTYPQLTQYVKHQIPTLIKHAFIRKNLKKYGNFTDQQLTDALTWGLFPTITIVNFKVIACGAAGLNAYGCTRKANPDAIEVGKLFVDDFEGGKASSGKDNKNSRGNLVYIVGATLLHELCHWGNYKNGVAEAEEMGLAFEKAAYGKTIW